MPEPPPSKTGVPIPRNVKALGTVSLLTDIHSETILPLLPLFLVNVLQVDKTMVGLIEGVADAMSSLLKLASGWLSDKVGKRKPLIVIGYGISALSKPFLAAAATGFHVLLVRFCDRVGKGVRTSPRDATISDSTPKEIRGKAFGFHRAMDTTGAIIGSLLAFGLMRLESGDYRRVFLLATIPGVLAVMVCALFVREVPKAHAAKDKAASGIPRRRMANPQLWGFVIANTVFSCGAFSYAFFILRAQEMGVTASLIPIIYLFYNVVYVIMPIPFGVISDKIGRVKMILFAYFVYALLCLGFAFATKVWHAWALFAVYGVYSAVHDPVGKAFVSDVAAPDEIGTAMGLFHSTSGVAALPASLLAGVLWDRFGVRAPFYYGLLLSVLASALLIALARPRKIA